MKTPKQFLINYMTKNNRVFWLWAIMETGNGQEILLVY